MAHSDLRASIRRLQRRALANLSKGGSSNIFPYGISACNCLCYGNKFDSSLCITNDVNNRICINRNCRHQGCMFVTQSGREHCRDIG